MGVNSIVGRPQQLKVVFKVDHSRHADSTQFRVHAKKRKGAWPREVQGELANVQYQGIDGARDWSVQPVSHVEALSLTDTTAIFEFAVSDSALAHLSFVFVQTYDMPGVDLYEIKLAEWAR